MKVQLFGNTWNLGFNNALITLIKTHVQVHWLSIHSLPLICQLMTILKLGFLQKTKLSHQQTHNLSKKFLKRTFFCHLPQH